MGGTVTLYPISYQLGDLKEVAREEVAFHLVLSRISNEIAILKTQAMLASTGSGEASPMADVSIAAAILNVKLLAGRVYEAWQFLVGEESGAIYRRLLDNLPDDVKARSKEIGTYFGKENLISRLRNKIAFHIDAETNYRAVETLGPETQITEYLSEHRGSVYYGGGWLLAATQLQIVMGDESMEQALDRFRDEVMHVADLLMDFIEGVNAAFLERHLDLSLEKFRSVKMEIANCPDIRGAVIPFFFDTSGYIAEQSASSKVGGADVEE